MPTICFLILGLCAAQVANATAGSKKIRYIYEGNNFGGADGELKTSDRLSGRFAVDCRVAHSAGACENLAYDDYLASGAVDPQSSSFSAGSISWPPSNPGTSGYIGFGTDYLHYPGIWSKRVVPELNAGGAGLSFGLLLALAALIREGRCTK
ncbi:hypothetical protein [Pseudohalioglobus lutimaris]|uniref:PEP-CTERM sorting domain-containing protein n=1 Tax=Pseudohalioglobus lutimaris TaxID=1737061 RepID=A0A2N5X0K0_9GAMM|nr:hypothetical protein [Pseudohalioglobus lutimaris]PLW68035.1 hypothetical protein C0039_13800 [Pseudohalioglobus lutimaris]